MGKKMSNIFDHSCFASTDIVVPAAADVLAWATLQPTPNRLLRSILSETLRRWVQGTLRGLPVGVAVLVVSDVTGASFSALCFAGFS